MKWKMFVLMLFSFTFAEKDFYWKSVDVSVNILKNGDIQVKEKQILNFIDKFTFGFRTIPTNVYGKNDGIKYLKLLEYKNNEIIQYKPSTSSNPFSFVVNQDTFSTDLAIYWYFPETSGIHTYEFSYTVHRAIRKHKNSKELFWKLIPSDHQQIIEKFTSRISFEDPKVKVKSKHGFINGHESVVKLRNGIISENQNILEISCDNLYQGDYFEVKLIYDSVFEIEQGLWVEREMKSRSLDIYFSLFGIVYLLIPLILVFWIYKEPNLDSFEEEASLPSNLPPALANSLISNYESSRDVVATLVNLCRKGYLKIEDTGTDWVFKKVKSLSELDEHEFHVVNYLFSSSNVVTLSSLDQKFYQHMDEIYKHIQNELKTRSLIHTIPSRITGRMITLGLFFPLSSYCIGLIQFLVGLNVRMYFMYIFSVIGFLMMLVYSLNRSFNVKTLSGTKEAKKWKNFKIYLTKISKGDQKIDPVIYESYLPFAIAFGVVDYLSNWNQMFNLSGTEPSQPSWYVHTGLRDEFLFGSRFNEMCRTSENTFMSSPPSDSSSSSDSSSDSGGGGSMGFG
jgi:hypothetical protein